MKRPTLFDIVFFGIPTPTISAIGPEAVVLDQPYLAMPAQRSSNTGPPVYIGWILFAVVLFGFPPPPPPPAISAIGSEAVGLDQPTQLSQLSGVAMPCRPARLHRMDTVPCPMF
jgi:hypothetical protein